MEQTYHIGECPVCKGYGRMEVLFDCNKNKCFVMCEECDLEFSSLKNYLRMHGQRIYYYYNPNHKLPVIRPATLDEIIDTEWYPLVTDK